MLCCGMRGEAIVRMGACSCMVNMKSIPTVLLTGAAGQLGFDLRRSLAPIAHVVATDRSTCDLADVDSIRCAVRDIRPDVILNAAAYTAVDRAETEPQVAFAINGVAPGILAEEAKAIGALLVHYSTDYVFDGDKDGWYLETDPPAPRSVYGESKLQGERSIEAVGGAAWVFRTSWVFSAHGANFAKTMLNIARNSDRLRVVSDQIGAPTSSALVADVTAHAVRERWLHASADRRCSGFELFHLTAAGETSWYEYAREVVGFMLSHGMPMRVQADQIVPILTAEFPLPASRPKNSRLNTHKLREAFDLNLPDWKDGLHHVLEQLLD